MVAKKDKPKYPKWYMKQQRNRKEAREESRIEIHCGCTVLQDPEYRDGLGFRTKWRNGVKNAAGDDFIDCPWCKYGTSQINSITIKELALLVRDIIKEEGGLDAPSDTE